jgi:hypothetical protein
MIQDSGRFMPFNKNMFIYYISVVTFDYQKPGKIGPGFPGLFQEQRITSVD